MLLLVPQIKFFNHISFYIKSMNIEYVMQSETKVGKKQISFLVFCFDEVKILMKMNPLANFMVKKR